MMKELSCDTLNESDALIKVNYGKIGSPLMIALNLDIIINRKSGVMGWVKGGQLLKGQFHCMRT